MTLGIYVHLPFCRRRCTYCTFAISTDHKRQEAYVDALLTELERSPHHGEQVDTLYFGGGTPSLTPFQKFHRVVRKVHSTFQVAADAEVSLEVNPEDVTPELLGLWRNEAGVNRVSLGVQSFHDHELYPLGRGHSAQTARQAVTLALDSGAQVSLDLILGLPHQTSDSFAQSLREALGLGIGHLSTYMLDLEEGSVLEEQVRRGSVWVPDDVMISEAYEDAIALISRAGLRQYEVSNFARPGQECRHNLKYWNREPYLGFGLGAHSFHSDQRWANTRDIAEYIDRLRREVSPATFREFLGTRERIHESIFLGLRQARGMRYSELIALRGEEASEWISRGLSEGWLRSSEDRIAFTGPGFLLSNDYISQLF